MGSRKQKQPNAKKAVWKLLLAIPLLGTVTLLLAQHVLFWPLELIVSQLPLFYWAIITLFVVTTCVSIFKQPRYSRIYIIGMAVLLIALPVYTLSITQPSQANATPNAAPDITYAAYNKLYTNLDVVAASTYLKESGADIVSLQEVNAGEVAEIAQILGHQHTMTSTEGKSAYGTEIGLVSAYPILESRTVIDVDIGLVIRSVVDIPSYGAVAVYTVHITPPISRGQYDDGIRSFNQLTAELAAEQLPVLVGGDFNTTVFSPKLRAVQQHVQIATTMRVPECSWFLPLPFKSICMRIDHILYGNDAFTLIETTVGPHAGSDHRPVVTTLQYRD